MYLVVTKLAGEDGRVESVDAEFDALDALEEAQYNSDGTFEGGMVLECELVEAVRGTEL